jgi:peptidyl-prolyl cis-trans isomerase SurA
MQTQLARSGGARAWWSALLFAVFLTMGRSNMTAQQLPVAAPQVGTDSDNQGVELDRVVAVVNGDVILDSDVQEERRMRAFQPFRDEAGTFSREETVDRLIDRSLILQQASIQQPELVTEEQVNAQIGALRREIPACVRYDCKTEAGWSRFVRDQGFTLQEFTDRWRQRMEVLAFIELRFKTGIHISGSEVEEYYERVMLPEYAKAKVPAPPLQVVEGRVQEVLLQEKVSALLDEWLKSLRAQGSVRILVPERAQ